ncbi:MAG: hypothetical protein MUF35_08180 [Candidatus Nanopelagicales bacterium]|jgi:Na+-transporting methylmalonyl-CoA/oxaloacetate decarboxylase gamma subunit|nr:hypothetical protein [Candidatus Nanopelagicales bacterium]
MQVDLGLALAVLLLLAFVVWRLSALAARIDRLHIRIDLARGALDAQLLRRARAAEALAASGLIDPASAIVLARAASNARHVGSADTVEHGLVESEMSRDLREVFADPEAVEALRELPEGQELVDDLAAACQQVTLARRFLNDGVAAARLLRGGRLVRWFRLAGYAPMPQTFEMDDEAPPTLLSYV